MRISTASAGLAAAFFVMWGTSGSASTVIPIHAASLRSNSVATSSAKVVYVSDRTLNKVLIYALNQANPIGSITRGIVEPQGIAVDTSGNLYVANGNGGNVQEYAPGGKGPIHTFVTGLRHPVNVTVDAHENVYVAEQMPSSIVVYPAASRAVPKIYLLPIPADPVRGVAVDLAGDILTSVSGLGDFFPLSGSCLAVSGLYVIPFGTTVPLRKFASANEQEFGLAADPYGRVYASDPCLNNVAGYSLPSLTFEGYMRNYQAFSQPFYLTIANGYLSVPSANGGKNGFVTIVKMSASAVNSYIITSGLQGPVSAVVGSLGAF